MSHESREKKISPELSIYIIRKVYFVSSSLSLLSRSRCSFVILPFFSIRSCYGQKIDWRGNSLENSISLNLTFSLLLLSGIAIWYFRNQPLSDPRLTVTRHSDYYNDGASVALQPDVMKYISVSPPSKQISSSREIWLSLPGLEDSICYNDFTV